MSATLKYIGTEDRWDEIAVTGNQSLWRIGQIEERSDEEAAQLYATGLFDVDDEPVVAKLNPVTGERALSAGADALGPILPEIANYAALRAYGGPLTSFYVRGVSSLFDGGAGVFRVDSADTTSTDNGGTILVDASGRRWRREFSGAVLIAWFEGADSSGTANSLAAIVRALAVGGDVALTSGTYRLSAAAAQTIASQGSQRLYGEGNVTIKIDLTSSVDLFVFNGPVAIENLTIDFNNSFARYPFKWSANAGHVCIKNVRPQNLKDADGTTGSITFFIVPDGNTFDIDGINASSMLKRGSGFVTDAAGSYNMIYVGGGAGATQGSIRNVFVNEVHNIDAAGQVIYEDTAVIYIATGASDAENRIEISNIQGVNFGKRLLKIHASNVTVDNVAGYSTEGDSLGVIGFMTGEGLGDKYGNAASNVRAYGLMELAFSASAFDVRWKNVIASVQPGNKAGMSNAAFGLLVSGDGTSVDGFWSDSSRDISIGSSSKAITNTTIRNAHLVLNGAKVLGIHNSSATTGFDGVLIDGLTVEVKADAPAGAFPISFADYFDGATKKGRNLTVRDMTVRSNGPLNSYCLYAKYIENVSIETVRYVNTSGLSHFRLIDIENCANVNIDDVAIDGINQIGVFIKDCDGRNTISRVYNPNASIAAVYNSNSANVLVSGCDQAKVSGATTATPQHSKYTSGATETRPTTGLVVGYSQHFDTTLGKPVWWAGASWKDAAGAVV